MADRRSPARARRSRLSSDRPVILRAAKLIGGGRALAHTGDATWMVAGALPGEIVRALPQRRRARIIEAVCAEVIENPHPARLSDPCPHAAECGGCDWPHVAPAAGGRLKAAAAAEAVRRFPEISRQVRDSPVTSSPPSYRLRIRLHWDPSRAALGFFDRRSWSVTAIPHCRIVSPTLAAILGPLTSALAAHTPEPVDVEIIEGADHRVAALAPSRPGAAAVPASWLPPPPVCPFLDGFHILHGADGIAEGWGPTSVRIALPISLEVPVGAFFQCNRHLLRPLFDRVAEVVGSGPGPVIDLHAGVGLLAAAAIHAGRNDLTVVEPHRRAAAAAQRNLPAAAVFHTTAEAFLTRPEKPPRDAVAVTDPPRTGMSGRLRRALVEWRPRRIVMLGCDPATWGRDADELLAAGYAITTIELFDLFPHTHHVEILSVLSRE